MKLFSWPIFKTEPDSALAGGYGPVLSHPSPVMNATLGGRAVRTGRSGEPVGGRGAFHRPLPPARGGPFGLWGRYRAMALFTDTLAGTFDGKKGRLSVPAAFRGLLSRMGAEAVVLRRSDHSPCIEVWPQPVFEQMVERLIADLDPFSPDFARRSRKLVGRASTLSLDAEGRLVVPKPLADAAGLKDAVAFAGRARFFEIWDAPTHDEHERREEAA